MHLIFFSYLRKTILNLNSVELFQHWPGQKPQEDDGGGGVDEMLVTPVAQETFSNGTTDGYSGNNWRTLDQQAYYYRFGLGAYYSEEVDGFWLDTFHYYQSVNPS